MQPAQYIVLSVSQTKRASSSAYSAFASTDELWKVSLTNGYYSGETMDLYFHDQAEADSAVDALVANLERQTDLYQRRIPGFPSDEWKKLFGTQFLSDSSKLMANL